MVSIAKGNAYELRDYLLNKVIESIGTDPFRSCFLSFLGLDNKNPVIFDFGSLSLYQRCAISGLKVIDDQISTFDVYRLLGQAPKIDSTPMQWVTDIFGVMAVKWVAEQKDDRNLEDKFQVWLNGFLPQYMKESRFNAYEKDIANHLIDSQTVLYKTACIPLFLHYQGIQLINDHQNRLCLINEFMPEFRKSFNFETSGVLLSIMIFVFDKVNLDVALVPPNGWTQDDLIGFLEGIPIGLKKWTWEKAGRTKGAVPVKWHINNEYHVQNLLYVLLAPIFVDIDDEIYLKPVGQKTPRLDLYIPPMHTIIEVKYRKNEKKSFQALIGEIAEDASLYRSDLTYKDAQIICFLWDCTRSTQEHAKFKEGILKIDGVDACVVLSAPSMIK